MIVLLNVDKVIKIIRNADEPKADLIKAFKLTERQADDILDMRLRQLAKLEHIKVEQELDEKKKERKGLEKILGSRKALEEVVICGDRGRREDLRRQAPHAHRGGREGGGRDPGHRRAGDGDLLEERLGAGAAGLGRGPGHAVVQGRRCARRARPVPDRRSGGVPGLEWPRLCRRGVAAAARARRRRAGVVARRRPGGRQDHVLHRRQARHARCWSRQPTATGS